MRSITLRRMEQHDAASSPWALRHRILLALWHIIGAALFRPTPKPMWRWRAMLLRLFGAKLNGVTFVASTARIRIPWNLEMHNYSCIGENANVYNLANCVVSEGATVAQDAYLCGGTHDFTSAKQELVVGEIVIGKDAFVGARAFVMPGVQIGEGAVIGACAVVTRDTEDWIYAAGNPCRKIRTREKPK